MSVCNDNGYDDDNDYDDLVDVAGISFKSNDFIKESLQVKPLYRLAYIE